MSKNIRVCHFTSAHNSYDNRVFYKECVSLAQAGYDVYLVAKGESRIDADVKVIGIGDAPKSRFKRMLLFSRRVYKRAMDLECDVYHFHDPELLLYALKLKRKGKKVIFDSHERYQLQILTKTYLPVVFRKLVSKLYDICEAYVLKRIDGAIFVGTISGSNPFSGICRNTEIVRNAAKLEEFYDKYRDDSTKEERGVCYIGSITKARGITNMVKGTYKAGGVLYLGGNFSSDQYRDELESLEEYKCVRYLGYLDRDKVEEVMSKCVAGLAIVPNNGQYWAVDSWGIKVYEYMSMGIPVIRENSPLARAMMEQYKVGICVDPTDADDLAKALAWLFNNPQEAKIMGNRGRYYIQSQFNWNSEEAKLLKLYKNINQEVQ